MPEVSSEQLEANSTEIDRASLEKIFPQEDKNKVFNLGIIAIHGNEPPIMTAAVAMEINRVLNANGLDSVPIVLPSVYGEKTKRIMLEEFPDNANNIYLSEKLGEILKKTEFSRAGYQAHLRSVEAKQPRVQDDLLEFLSHEFTAVSLSGEERAFEPRFRKIELNAGANVTASDKKDTHFFFPVLLSELMEATKGDPALTGHFDRRNLEKIKRYAEQFEKRYLTTQVPAIATLSAEVGYSTKGKILTPPLKSKRTPPSLFVKNGKGIYLMASGNEIGKEAVEDQARVLHDTWGYDVLSPSWLQLDFGKQAIPDIIFSPDVKVVLGRAGWGIMWMAQVANKPFIALPHLWFDNPEIHFNIKALKEHGLGIEFTADGNAVDLVQSVTSPESIAQLNQKIANELGTGNKDGIKVTAENILKAEIENHQ